MITSSQAYAQALDTVRAALSGGAVKLEGPNSNNYNEAHIKADSEYLNGLINSIAQNILDNVNK